MTQKNILVSVCLLFLVAAAGYFSFKDESIKNTTPQNTDGTPYNVTLSGTYVCLPHLDTEGPQTMECAFGLKTDDGVYYAVNFGASQNSMSQFQSGTHITAEGFVVIKEALSTNQWEKYNMKGIFTITKLISPAPAQAKINIDAVCQGALVYMTFPDAKSAEVFVQDCKDGKHPEVIEQYKAQMNLGDGAAI